MGYLIDAWLASQRKFDLNLKAVVTITGDESLEKKEAVEELRAFFSMIDMPTMERLMQECYSKDKKLKFDARGYAFQDLINEMGRRLGYKTENGLYRGRKNEVGFDGLWESDDGFMIIMESKATGDYAFSPETVIGYRDKLIRDRGISKKKCSILVVYGRDEKSTLRNAVKGSDESANIRLISANALFQLVKLASDPKAGININQIYTLLRPQDYFVLDNLVELVFPQTDDDIEPIDELDEEKTPEKKPVAETNMHEHMKSGEVPALPDETLKVGKFVKTAMENLSESGYEFSEEVMESLLAENSMHSVIGMQRNLPFFKLYDPEENNGHLINGRPRYYSKPFIFGDVKVYVNSQIYDSDKEKFIDWYKKL